MEKAGLKINDSQEGWFNNNYIHFKYRLKGRKITLPWIYGAARSMFLIEKIHQHDWLRRRAGELAPFKKDRIKRISKLIGQLLNNNEKFKRVRTPDFTINSRILLRDMISTSISNGLEFSIGNEIVNIEKKLNKKYLSGSIENIQAKKNK